MREYFTMGEVMKALGACYEARRRYRYLRDETDLHRCFMEVTRQDMVWVCAQLLVSEFTGLDDVWPGLRTRSELWELFYPRLRVFLREGRQPTSVV